MKHSDNISNLSAALTKVQVALEGAKKDGTNPHFHSHYATLASVWDACRALLAENGLSICQGNSVSENGLLITDTLLMHASGEWIHSQLSMPLPKNDPQGTGSAVSYSRRYSLAAIVGVCPEDDDAEGAQGRGNDFGRRDAAINAHEATREKAARAVQKRESEHVLAAPEADEIPMGNASDEQENGDWRDVVLHFSKNKGVRLGDLSAKQISWYADLDGGGWNPRPFKGKFSADDVALFNALNVYRLSQGKPARTLPGTQPVEEESEF